MALISGLNTDITLDLEADNLEIHIHMQQRNGKKCLTLVDGLSKIKMKYNLDDFAKQLRKKFNCSGIVTKEKIIQLQGDHREGIKQYLIDQKIISKDKIKVHG